MNEKSVGAFGAVALVPAVDGVGLALFAEAVQSDPASGVAVGDLQKRGGALAHVCLLVVVAGLFEFLAFRVGKVEFERLGPPATYSGGVGREMR